MKTKSRSQKRAVEAKPISAPRQKARVFLHLDKILPHLPIPTSQEQIRAWEKSGLFPRGARWGSQKASPQYEAEAVIAWARDTFSRDFPEEVEQFARTLRAMDSCSLTSFHRTKRPTSPTTKQKYNGS
jgi:hypothetical protein